MQLRFRCLKAKEKSSRWEMRNCHCRRWGSNLRHQPEYRLQRFQKRYLSHWHQLNRFRPVPLRLPDHRGRFRQGLREDHRRLQVLHLGRRMRYHQGHRPMMLSLRVRHSHQSPGRSTARLLLRCWLRSMVLPNLQLQYQLQ